MSEHLFSTHTTGQHTKAGDLHERKMEEKTIEPLTNECNFTHWRVNPDVIKFNAASLANVKYHGKEIQIGQILTVEDTQQPPEVHWQLTGPTAMAHKITGTTPLYTLIMCDPDAPSNANPTYRNWCHWVVVNIPGSCDISKGHVVCPYMGPAPPPNTGLHRYVFLVYPQKSALRDLKTMKDDDRKGWSVEDFLHQHYMHFEDGAPCAGNMYRCQNAKQSGH